LARARLPVPGGLRPGTGGAPPAGGPDDEVFDLSIIGAERSLTCVTFFSRAPLLISLSRAPCRRCEYLIPRYDMSAVKSMSVVFLTHPSFRGRCGWFGGSKSARRRWWRGRSCPYLSIGVVESARRSYLQPWPETAAAAAVEEEEEASCMIKS
jgi:hypothetical protein